MKEFMPEFELKFNRSKEITPVQMTTPKETVAFAHQLFDQDTIEYSMQVIAIYLDVKNKTLGFSKITEGGLNLAGVDSRKIFSQALLSGATTVVLVHNAPSGDPKPSQSDNTLTYKLRESGVIMDIKMIDHVIITKDQDVYFSYAEDGEL